MRNRGKHGEQKNSKRKEKLSRQTGAKEAASQKYTYCLRISDSVARQSTVMETQTYSQMQECVMHACSYTHTHTHMLFKVTQHVSLPQLIFTVIDAPCDGEASGN